VVLVILMPGKKVLECHSSLNPSEKELPEQRSGVFHHKSTTGYNNVGLHVPCCTSLLVSCHPNRTSHATPLLIVLETYRFPYTARIDLQVVDNPWYQDTEWQITDPVWIDFAPILLAFSCVAPFQFALTQRSSTFLNQAPHFNHQKACRPHT
jgi:hypothetical protein